MYTFKIADRTTHDQSVKTVQGKEMILVATQESKRSIRKGNFVRVWNLEGTHEIYYTQSGSDVIFIPIARRKENMKKYYEVFCVDPVTQAEQTWLARNNYSLVQ